MLIHSESLIILVLCNLCCVIYKKKNQWLVKLLRK
jgi:hypothetical protein